MAYCSNCGAELNNDAKFCSKCGVPINGGAQQVSQNQNLNSQNYAYQNLNANQYMNTQGIKPKGYI